MPNIRNTERTGNCAGRVKIKGWQSAGWRATPSARAKLAAGPKTGFLFMSQHRSLRAAATLGGKRNVLKRYERLELLKKRGQWKEGERITGLRKTKKDA